jgi:hypothetical protein
MLSSHRGTCAALALMVFASLAATASIAARAEEPRHEHAAPERARQPARREPARRASYHSYAQHPQPAHAVPGHATYEHAHAVSNYYPRTPTHSSGTGVYAPSHAPTASPPRVAGYGNTFSRTFERTIRPGLVSRTFVSGGMVATRMYQSHVWHQFGRAFAYETFVPRVWYPGAYYSWALAAWPHPMSYAWGWRAQPWYPQYGFLFTPYPVYSSPDLWMTDYIIAQNMQAAYTAQVPASQSPAAQLPAPQLLAPQLPAPPATEAMDGSAATPSAPPSDAPAAATPNESSPTPPAGEGAVPQATPSPPAAPIALPPVMTPAVKAQLDTQIKVQLQDRRAAAATPATLTTDSTPPALRPNHVFFEVVTKLNVPAGSANQYCSLSPNDYIRRTGAMSPDDWMIPVVVQLSAASDCPVGLHTYIGLNDLNAMENEQEAQVMDAMQAASKSMGPNGPPNTPGVHPTLIADGSATPDLGAPGILPQER